MFGMMCRPRAGMLSAAFCILATAFAAAAARADVPSVVVTVKPIHSIVADVMRGIAAPTLLLPDGASPHAYAMRPADARRLHGADLIVWVGAPLESFLVRPMRLVAETASVMTVMDEPDMLKLEIRKGGLWDHSTGDHGNETSQHTQHDSGRRAEYDAHLWLDPENASVLAQAVAARLARLDPENGAAYRANATRVAAGMTALGSEIRASLAPVKAAPFLVFHDGYQYFEHRFGLNGVGSLALSPELRPGARRLYEIRRRVLDRKVRCVFSEPQFQPRLVETVVRGTNTRTAELDPLGAGIEAGPDAYGAMMRRIARSFRACLSAET